MKSKNSTIIGIQYPYLSISLFTLLMLGRAQTLAMSEVSISRNLESISRAEVMSAYTGSDDAIFYNPAGLAFQNISVELVSVDIEADDNSNDKAEELHEQESFNAKELVSNRLLSDTITLARAGGEILSLTFPYFSVKSFINTKLNSMPLDDGAKVNFRLRFGATLGLGIKAGDFAFGWSSYYLKQASITSTPSDSQVDEIIQANENDQLEDYDFSSFSAGEYGETTGHNFGLLYNFGEKNNPSSFGLSILNIGGAKFSDQSKLRGSFARLEDEARDEAAQLGIELSTPQELKQMINAGLHFSSDQGEKDYFLASFSFDYQDIGGSTLDNHFAFASELGFRLSDNAAIITSVPIGSHDGEKAYIGLTGLKVVGGYRIGEYISSGVIIDLHAGFGKLFSIIRARLSFVGVKTLDEALIPSTTGNRATVGLTLIIPDFGSDN